MREGAHERDRLVEHGAERVDVGPVIDPVAIARNLLRRHVRGRAQERPAPRHRRLLEDPGQPEVGQAEPAVAREQQVPGFHVAVDDDVRVRRLERLRHLRDEPRGNRAPGPRPGHGSRGGERRPHDCLESPGANVVEHPRQRRALHQVHCVEVAAVALAGGVDRHDAGVVQPSGGVRLAPEPLDGRTRERKAR